MPWGEARTVTIAGNTAIVQGHPDYAKAKAGDLAASMRLVSDILTPEALAQLNHKHGAIKPTLVGVHAVEGASVNAIPQAMSAWIHENLGWPVDDDIVQINRVSHTKATGWHRLANQAVFDGTAAPGHIIFCSTIS